MAYPFNHVESDLFLILIDLFGEHTDEDTVLIIYHILACYLIGIRNGPDDCSVVRLTSTSVSNLLSHFHVIDHPQALHARLYWYQYAFAQPTNPYDLSIEREIRAGVILTRLANHAHVLFITDLDSDPALLDPEMFLH